MQLRCDVCGRSFEAQSAGPEACPGCGWTVMPDVYAPPSPEGAAAMAAGVPGVASRYWSVDDPVGEMTPWERRGELGWLPGFGKTVGAVLSEPGTFFERIDYGSSRGAHLYWLACAAVVQSLVSLAYFWFMNPAQVLEQKMNDLPADAGPAATELLMKVHDFIALFGDNLLLGGAFFVGASILGWWTWFTLWAAATHLLMKVFGEGGGFSATLKAFAYSDTPRLFGMVPIIGFLGHLWALVLNVIAVRAAHRSSTGIAVLAVLGGWILVFILFLLLVGIAVAALIAVVARQL